MRPHVDPVALTFVVLPIALAVALLRATARVGGPVVPTALVTVVWMVGTWTAAASGVLAEFERRPPPFVWLVLGIVGLASWLGLGRLGGRLAAGLPLWLLVGVQAFRLPLEIAMHALADRGVMPPQMSYSGLNFDIVTGATAIVVAGLVAAGVAGRRLVLAWNLLGVALLVNIVAIAIASTPVFAAFGPDRLNVFVMHPPFVWLPAVLVLAALAGHLMVFRAVAAPGPSGSSR